jgi:zona occludens toxin
MAQFAYTGIQGSGKSYEVVQGVIVPNVAKGRRVVTNVTGLQYEKICAYITDNFQNHADEFGEIVQVDNERISEPFFFPLEEKESPFLAAIARITDADLIADLQNKHLEWKNSFLVKGGDIVILDECWRWYTSDAPLPDNHLKFFRMHRHFLHPVSGQCCDIVLIVQDIGDLRRNIRATLEKSFLMQKHTDLGMPDRYVVSVYGGNKQIKRAFIEDFQKKYNPEIFPLYQSHSQKEQGGADAKEERVDTRGSIFNRKIIK